MFTGLVEAIGAVLRISRSGGGAVLVVERPGILDDLTPGASVCVSGACLTVRDDLDARSVAFDVSPETLQRTTLGALRPGSRVNLERALSVEGRLGGHVVNGHVDATTTVTRLERTGGFSLLGVAIGASWARYVVEKGSVALDGVSLTVAALTAEELKVAVIPATWEATTLGERRPGDRVNVEADILAKYVERLLAARPVDPAGPRDDRLRALLSGTP